MHISAPSASLHIIQILSLLRLTTGTSSALITPGDITTTDLIPTSQSSDPYNLSASPLLPPEDQLKIGIPPRSSTSSGTSISPLSAPLFITTSLLLLIHNSLTVPHLSKNIALLSLTPLISGTVASAPSPNNIIITTTLPSDTKHNNSTDLLSSQNDTESELSFQEHRKKGGGGGGGGAGAGGGGGRGGGGARGGSGGTGSVVLSNSATSRSAVSASLVAAIAAAAAASLVLTSLSTPMVAY